MANPSASIRSASLPPGRENLEFRYTGLSFLFPSRITFRYKLEGFDKDWIDAGTRRQAFYTNLPPGRFRFRVEAANVDGASGGSTSVSFRSRRISISGGGSGRHARPLAGLAVWLGIRLRIRRIKSQMAAILAERSRIARELHDTLIQGFSGVTMEMQALTARLPEAAPRGVLQEIIRDAGNCLSEARRSVAGLRNSARQWGIRAVRFNRPGRPATHRSARHAVCRLNLAPERASVPRHAIQSPADCAGSGRQCRQACRTREPSKSLSARRMAAPAFDLRRRLRLRGRQRQRPSSRSLRAHRDEGARAQIGGATVI